MLTDNQLLLSTKKCWTFSGIYILPFLQMVPFLRAGHICSYLQIHTQGLFQDFAPVGANASCPNMGGGGGGGGRGKYKLY